MRCRKVHSFLSTYCSGETDPRLTAKIEKHLDDCPECRKEAGVHASVRRAVKELPEFKTSDDFNAKLLSRVAQEGFAESRSKAYIPGRVPLFGRVRLATISAAAVIVIALAVGVNIGNGLFAPGPQTANNSQYTNDDDAYLTVQPNPLLVDRSSVNNMIQRYNRFKQLSRTLRTNAGAEQFGGGVVNASMATSRTGGTNMLVRPVVKYYITP